MKMQFQFLKLERLVFMSLFIGSLITTSCLPPEETCESNESTSEDQKCSGPIEEEELPASFFFKFIYRDGIPATRLPVYTYAPPGAIADEERITYITDNNGKVEIPTLYLLDDSYFTRFRKVYFSTPGGVRHNLANSFLRRRPNLNMEVNFVTGVRQYDIFLEKIVFDDGHFGYATSELFGTLDENCRIPKKNCFPCNMSIPCVIKKYTAQSFDLDKTTSICTMGIGLGYSNIGRPDRFQIRADSAGQPGSVLVEVRPEPEQAYAYIVTERSNYGNGEHGSRDFSYARFCDRPSEANSKSISPLELGAGRYWAVAVYDEVPEKVGLNGSEMPSRNGIPTMSSEDGLNWSEADWGVQDNGRQTRSMAVILTY